MYILRLIKYSHFYIYFNLLLQECNRSRLISIKIAGTHISLEHIKKKYLGWHSHNFLLPCITEEEYFIISTTFIFYLYFLYFVVEELPAFIIIVYNL